MPDAAVTSELRMHLVEVPMLVSVDVLEWSYCVAEDAVCGLQAFDLALEELEGRCPRRRRPTDEQVLS